jgi:YVTN family beta-propeller protein
VSSAEAQTFAYVSNATSNNVSVIDTATNLVDATVPVGQLPIGLAATPDGSRVYVAALNGGRVDVIDTTTNTLLTSILTPGQNPAWIAISPDGARGYLSISIPFEVKVIDTATNTIIATISLPAQANRLAVTPDGSRVYVPMGGGAGVEVIDTASNTSMGNIAITSSASAVAFTPDGSRAYVTNDNVTVVDTGTNTVLTTIVMDRAFHVVVSPDGSRAYVTHLSKNKLSVIDTASNTLLPPIPLVTSSQGLAITPDGGHIYLADNVTVDNVSVVDTSTKTVAAIIGVGGDPHDVVIASPPSCVDVDGDGYGSPGGASCPNGAAEDCNDDDPEINPAAFEVPGNLVDENCDGDLGPCCPFLDWRNHGQYVRCVAQDAEALVETGLLTQEEADALVSSSARTDIGKKDFVPDPAQCTE